jgi:arsenate reductase (glutaredoxin)
MTLTLYGIPNCDTVKKARTWLDDHGIAYAFHDYKKSGVPAANLDRWCREAGWERVLNRAGTTFKKLPEDAKTGLDEAKAKRLMIAQPSMIKRPIVEHGQGLLVGFSPDDWDAALGPARD